MGLVRINGSCDATHTLQVVDNHLQQFGVSFTTDIVATTNDGAPVMEKYGRNCPAKYQLCLNHGIHLAVTDVFYVKKSESGILENDSDSDSNTDDDSTASGDTYNEINFEVNVDESEELELSSNIATVISDTRKIIKFFKYSPVKNSILQNNVAAQKGKELSLLLDVRTRWISMEPMIARFLEIQECIKQSLSELNSMHLWHAQHIDSLNVFLNCLRPVKVVVEALSRQDATIVSSEGILKFMFSKLEEQGSSMSLMLLERLKYRIGKRRNKDLVSLAMYLNNPFSITNCNENKNGFFTYLSKNAVINFANNLMNRLFLQNNVTPEDEDDDIQDTPKLSLADELQNAISANSMPLKLNECDLNSLRKEFQLYEATGKKTDIILKLHNAVNSVKPTSTEAERVFSTAGKFVTRIRSRLGDKSIDSLVFLKGHFLSLSNIN